MEEQKTQTLLNLQECLALERTTLANERTFLSYARTSVMTFITGVTVFKLFPDMIILFIMGWGAIVFSTIIFFIGLKRFINKFKAFSKLKSGCFFPYDLTPEKKQNK